MAELRILPAAEEDYQNALAWYHGRSAQAAWGFESAAEAAFRDIADTPQRWARYGDRHQCYSLDRYPYRIIYRIEEDCVLVVAVAHSHRSDAFWQRRV